MGNILFSGCLIVAFFLLLMSTPSSQSQSTFTFFVVAPNTFYVDHNATVSVTVFNAPTAAVELFLTNEPVGTSTFSKVNLLTQQGQPSLIKMQVTRADLLLAITEEQYINLTVKCTVRGQTKQKKTLVRVTAQSHSVFLETDKPIYTPRQSVFTRIFTMDHHLKPADLPVRLDFVNPDGIIVQRFSNLHSADGFLMKNFTFPSTFGVEGKWSLVASYGVKNSQNVTCKFLVKEYVLPTFSVTIASPKYVSQGAMVTGNVTARHMYGKPVKGTVYMKFGIIRKNFACIIFAKKANLVLNNGGVTFTLNPDAHLQDFGSDFHFSRLDGAHLHIEATVTETATGKKESRINRDAMFAMKKHKVTFDRSAKYFKPGLLYVIKVALNSASGQPSTNLPLTINAVASKKGGEMVTLSPHENFAITDDNGKAMFTLDIPSDVVTLLVKAWPTDHKSDVDPNTALNVKPYHSPSKSYLLVRPRLDEYKVGNVMEVEVLATTPNDIKQLTYMVVVRGEIVYQQSVAVTSRRLITLHISVTPQMSPSARLLVYYLRQIGDSTEVVNDVAWIDIKDECRNKVSLSMSKSQFQPGQQEALHYRGASNSKLLLLAVDEAVYALGGKKLLTPKKMFNELERYDLGCGPGDGQDNADVLKNAGLTSVNNAGLIMSKPTGCDGKQRNKRAIRQIVEQDTDKCCQKGRCDTKRGTCRQRVAHKLSEMTRECAVMYFRCCSNAKLQPHITCPRSRTVNRSGSRALGPRGRTVNRSESRALDRQTGLERGLLGIPDMKYFTIGGFTSGRSVHKYNEDDVLEDDELEDDDFDDDFEMIDEEEEMLDIRTEFPESWLMETKLISASGHGSVRVTFPDSITTWLVQAVGVSTQSGMCVAPPLRVTVFRDFFLQLDLPYSVVLGEQVEVQATLYNYMHRYRLLAFIYLMGTEGICASALPGDKTDRKRIRVRSNDGYLVSWPIIPMKIGEFKIRAIARTTMGQDVVEKTLHVLPTGTKKLKSYTFVLDPSGKLRRRRRRGVDGVRRQVNQSEVIDLRLPDEAVPGSEKCVVNVIGKLPATTVSAMVEGLESVLKMPTGCCEQAMATLAPITYAMHYLNQSGQLTSKYANLAKHYIQRGIQKVLSYRKKDGSYGLYQSSQPTIWLTAFVAKVLAQSREFGLREDPSRIVCSAVKWVTKKQQQNGAFSPEGAFICYYEVCLGGVTDRKALTAFVLIAMIESKCDNTKTRLAIGKAVRYLESVHTEHHRAHTSAIIAYALVLAESPAKLGANARLKDMAKYDEESNTRYWPSHRPEVPSKKTQRKPPWFYRDRPKALEIETTGYALLAQLTLGNLEYSGAIVTWLVAQRTSQGAFISTQDTAVALQALSEYSIKTDKSGLDLRCIISTNGSNFRTELTFQDENAMVRQQVQVTELLGQNLVVNTTGTGVGQVEVHLEYHVAQETAQQDKQFSIDTTVSDYSGDDCDSSRGDISACRSSRVNAMSQRHRRSTGGNSWVIDIKVCIQYIGSNATGIAILDVGLFSGFEAYKEDLETLTNSVTTVVDRYELTDRAVIFYISSIKSDTPTCVTFKAKRTFVVGRVHPVAITVYDYYEPSRSSTTFYSLDQGSPLLQTICVNKECICAEGQCATCYGFEPNDDESPLSFDIMKNMISTVDYALKVTVKDIQYDAASQIIKVEIDRVLKKSEECNGLEAFIEVTFVQNLNCECAIFDVGDHYLIIGNVGLPYIDIEGDTTYKYRINDGTYVMQWVDQSTFPPGSPPYIQAQQQHQLYNHFTRRQ